MYFPEFEEEDGKLVGNPFSGTLDITVISSDIQDKFLDLKNASAAKDLYKEKYVSVFWSMHLLFPRVSEIALSRNLPFPPYFVVLKSPSKLATLGSLREWLKLPGLSGECNSSAFHFCQH